MQRLTDTRALVGLLSLALLAWLTVLLSPVLSALLAAAIFAYWGRPIVRRLQAWGLPSTLAVCLGFILLFGVVILAVVFLVPVLGQQLDRAQDRLPEVLALIQHNTVAWFEGGDGIRVSVLERLLDEPTGSDAGGQAPQPLLWNLSGDAPSMLATVGYPLLIPVASFYLLRDWDVLTTGASRWIPGNLRSSIEPLKQRWGQTMAAFFHGQVPVLLSLSALYALGLSLAGVEFGLLIGLLAGLASVVPYLGMTLGVISALAVASVGGAGAGQLLAILVVFALGQLLAAFILWPWLIGERPTLHPLMVVFSLLVGGHLLGLVGILLALPVAALVTAAWHDRRATSRPGREVEPPERDPATPDEALTTIDESMRQEDA